MKFEITDFNLEKGKCYLLTSNGYWKDTIAINILQNGRVIYANVYRDGSFGYPCTIPPLKDEDYLSAIKGTEMGAKCYDTCEEYNKIEFINNCYGFISELRNKVDSYFKSEQE